MSPTESSPTESELPSGAESAAGPASTPLQLLDPAGALVESDATAEFLPAIQALSDADLQAFHRSMVLTRRFDDEAGNLQRQGQLALWVPSHGQEAAQVGSAYATRAQDSIFPSYREHAVALHNGVDPVDIVRLLRGNTHGGWAPADHSNFHIYTLVIGSQTLHATGYAMGIALDGDHATGDPDVDEAAITYFGDGATSQGDVSEALVFAASFQAPMVFFLQNNQWAISVPVATQSRTPLYRRGEGFGVPSTQIDGNDVLISYAVTRRDLDLARSGGGPRFIEAQTYRMGAHTTSDDPTKYRTSAEVQYWLERDPIVRFEAYLRSRGESDAFFAGVEEEAADLAEDVRRRTLALEKPDDASMFAHVYSEQHPRIDEQREWLAAYEASFGGGA